MIVLRFFEDQKLEDIARTLQENTNTVKTILYQMCIRDRREVAREYRVKKKRRKKRLSNEKWKIPLIIVASVIGTPIGILLITFILVAFCDTAYTESGKSLDVYKRQGLPKRITGRSCAIRSATESSEERPAAYCLPES